MGANPLQLQAQQAQQRALQALQTQKALQQALYGMGAMGQMGPFGAVQAPAFQVSKCKVRVKKYFEVFYKMFYFSGKIDVRKY